MPGIFDHKIFNGEVFKGFVDRIPNPNRNELIKSRAIRPRPDLAAAMADQTGGNYLTSTLTGVLDSTEVQNYDGNNDVVAKESYNFAHSRVVVGRMNAWVERDFSYDLTGNHDHLEDAAELECDFRSFEGYTLESHSVLHHDDVKAENTEENPHNVVPHDVKPEMVDGKIVLPAASWNVLRLVKR